MNFSRTQSPLDPATLRLPLIALIDVVLFLLLYFMIAGTLASEEASLGAAVRTQAASGVKGSSGEISTFTLTIELVEKTPVFRLGSRNFKDQAALSGVLAQLNKSGGVIVRAAPDVPVWAIAGAIQAAKDAGFSRVSFVPTR
jgi:biopolymer transport protein ExbD